MTTQQLHTDTSAPTIRGSGTGRGLAVRRWILIAAPVLAGLFITFGAFADPAPGVRGAELLAVYGEEEGWVQFKSNGYHWAYALWMLPGLLVAPWVRGRGVWLANAAAVIAFGGIATLPGLLVVDFYDSAIVQEFGVEGGLAVESQIDAMAGLAVFAIPGLLGLFLALPLAAIALWRAGLVRWWAPVTVVLAFVAFSESGPDWWGGAIATGFLAVFSFALARATRPTPAEVGSRAG